MTMQQGLDAKDCGKKHTFFETPSILAHLSLMRAFLSTFLTHSSTVLDYQLLQGLYVKSTKFAHKLYLVRGSGI